MVLLLWVYLASSTTPSPPLDFSQLGIAAIVCVILSIGIWTLWREGKSKDAKIESLQLARIADAQAATGRERELADRYVPLLADTATALREAPTRFDRGFAEVAKATADIERLVTRVEAVLRDANR